MKKLRIILWVAAIINLCVLTCFLINSIAFYYTLIFMGPISLAGLILSIIMYKKDKKNGNDSSLALITFFIIPLAVAFFIYIMLLIDTLFFETPNVAMLGVLRI